MNRETIAKQYAINLSYARRLVADLDETRLCCQPFEQVVMNHPAWLLGHLAMACDFAGKILLQEPELSDLWNELFGWNTHPQSDSHIYPDKETLLSALTEGHETVTQAYLQANSQLLKSANPLDAASKEMPTVSDVVSYIMTTHEGVHLGQLSAWRRAMQLPSV